jgi:MATE family multidrug resistance protein
MAVGFMTCSAIVFSAFPKPIVCLFTPDLELVKVCIPVMYVLSIFQIFDGLQISLAGICKGVKQTDIVLLANFVAYWLVSIPLGYTLAFKYNMNISGFWIGLCSASIILCLIMLVKLKKFTDKIYKKQGA